MIAPSAIPVPGYPDHLKPGDRARRHMTASQAAIADAKRNRLTDAYTAVRDAAKERQVEALVKGNKTRHEEAPAGELIPQPATSRTRDIRAKAAANGALAHHLGAYELSMRMDNLSWTHHQIVAALRTGCYGAQRDLRSRLP